MTKKLPIQHYQLRELVQELEHLGCAGSGHESERSLAMEVWWGVLSSKWTLIDCFEQDGRQYLIARERPPAAANRLSKRERRVVMETILGRSRKDIAFQLSIAPSTVATYLRRALRKLCLETQTDLIRLIPPIAIPPLVSGQPASRSAASLDSDALAAAASE